LIRYGLVENGWAAVAAHCVFLSGAWQLAVSPTNNKQEFMQTFGFAGMKPLGKFVAAGLDF
jgi:hypothetical protein